MSLESAWQGLIKQQKLYPFCSLKKSLADCYCLLLLVMIEPVPDYSAAEVLHGL